MKEVLSSRMLSSFDLSKDVFIHPTNSCYGIGASIWNEAGYYRIYELKDRSQDKPFFITLSDISQLADIAHPDPRVEEYIHNYPEKICTFILKRSPQLPSYINSKFSTVGVQIARGALKDICIAAGGAMFDTSANIAGKDAIYDFSQIESVFGDFSDIIGIDAGKLEKSSPSTIIDLSYNEARILRGSLE